MPERVAAVLQCERGGCCIFVLDWLQEQEPLIFLPESPPRAKLNL